MNTEDVMLQQNELVLERFKVKQLTHQLETLRDFAIWMSGCAEFNALPYFRENRHLLYDTLEDTPVEFVPIPIKWKHQQFPLGGDERDRQY